MMPVIRYPLEMDSLTDNDPPYYYPLLKKRVKYHMQRSSIYSLNKPLFPQEIRPIDSFDIIHKNLSNVNSGKQSADFDEQSMALNKIEALDRELSQHFHDKLKVEPALTRQIVSFQANKSRANYRWYKYKEAFSAALVEYLLDKYGISTGRMLDPFAGSGTAMFAAGEAGMEADGIELLPIGQQIILVRMSLEKEFSARDFSVLRKWAIDLPWRQSVTKVVLSKLRITDGAYPEETVENIERFMSALQNENERVRAVLQFALLCVLESVSYTRKDGQYLRWDHRSGRRQGTRPFDKGKILEFDKAICAKIEDICNDLGGNKKSGELFPAKVLHGKLKIFKGSCLSVMPTFPDNSYDAVMTSPPYCNRYDYTRTYALELALLGTGEQELTKLRQEMLSCTVENRAKDLLNINPKWTEAIAAADKQELLQSVLRYLEDEKAKGRLNNNGIPRMVRGYFYEMACVIAECARVMKPDAYLFMVNDNVRYAGASISVDMILSNIAETLGFHVEKIFVLPNGKGNSSQQMGRHGRDPLRKCVYLWRKI
jgi:DNA modification methylase